MAKPVTLTTGAKPVTNVPGAQPMTPTEGALPVTLVDAGGYPVTLVNEDGTAWDEGAPAPTYNSGLSTFTEWEQNVTDTTLDLSVVFSNATSYSVITADGFSPLPPGVSISGSDLIIAPTGFQGREGTIIRATGPGGSVDRAFYISVRPDVTGGAFGTPYVTVYNGVTVSTLTTIAAADNVLVINCTINRQLQFRDCDNVLIIDSTFTNATENEDLLRLSNSTAPCSRLVVYGNTLDGGLKDGINISGDAPWHTDLYILNNDVGNVGNNPGFEHGMYIHCYANVVGNRITNCAYGNGISMRSSGRVAYNFGDGTYESFISYFADHPEDTPSLLLIEGNICVGTGTNGNDTDVRLRTDPRIATPATPGSMVNEYIIRNNVFTQLARSPVVIGDGYGGLIVTGGAGVGVEGNVRKTDAEARAMFPPA